MKESCGEAKNEERSERWNRGITEAERDDDHFGTHGTQIWQGGQELNVTECDIVRERDWMCLFVV